MESSDEGSVDGDGEHMNEDVASIASPRENGVDEAEERGSEVESNPTTPPQSPLSSHQSPSSPPQSPVSPPQSPVSPPQSPVSPPQSPLSPASIPQSPARSDDCQQSEDEVHVSEPEASDHEEIPLSDVEDGQSDKEAEQEDSDKEPSSDREEAVKDINNDVEESDQEENVPEISIDSGDEENERESISRNSGHNLHNSSDNEVEREVEGSDDGKESDVEDKTSANVEDEPASDIEANADSDAENDKDSQDKHHESPASSPMHELVGDEGKETNMLEDDDEAKPSSSQEKETEMSDAEENAESDNDANSDSEESEVGGLIADIFGESDDDEEFEGFNEEDIASTKGKKDKKKKTAKLMSDSEGEGDGDSQVDIEEKEDGDGIIEDLPAPPPESEDAEEKHNMKAQVVSDDDSDDDGVRKMREDFVSDFDLMMQKKKDENSKKRKRKDVDIINDSDDLIADIISQMRQAADEDRILNKQKKTATKKLKILPMVMSQLKKQDLKMAFLDQGVLNVMADWLAPLPDRSLPHLNIREGMIKQLHDFPSFDQSLLKSSGVGRALMYLFKHPKETKENRERAGKLITEWARPIFNVTTNYHSLTKEEREQRDYDHIPKKRKSRDQAAQDEEESEQDGRKDIDKVLSGEDKSLRPGDKGWIGRARVPMPSTKDYVHRPKWNVEMEFGRGPSKKPLSRIEKHMRTLQEKKRQSKGQRAITISIEGRKMAI